uniref:Protein SMG9 n=1 Tax=Percolomonas cosmopolitus TaxID=63605 RepID=A0A7S1KRY3_9EUKA
MPQRRHYSNSDNAKANEGSMGTTAQSGPSPPPPPRRGMLMRRPQQPPGEGSAGRHQSGGKTPQGLHQQPVLMKRPGILTRNSSSGGGADSGSSPQPPLKRMLLKRRDPTSSPSVRPNMPTGGVSPLTSEVSSPVSTPQSAIEATPPPPTKTHHHTHAAQATSPVMQPSDILKQMEKSLHPVHLSLIDANGSFQTSNFHTLHNMLKNTASLSYTARTMAGNSIQTKEEMKELYSDRPMRVIGVLGRSNAGKSSLIEKFGELIEESYSLSDDHKPSSTFNSTPSDDNAKTKKRSYISQRRRGGISTFKPASMSGSSNTDGSSRAVGVTVHIYHKKRVIFLEAQSLFSICAQTISKMDSDISSSGLSTPTSQDPSHSPENRIELLHFQLGALLFNSCHIILFVEDQFYQKDAFEFTKTIRMIQKSIPNTANQQPTIQTLGMNKLGSNTLNSIKYSVQEYIPEICFLFNKVDDNLLHAEVMKSTQQQLDEYFARIKFNKNGFISALREASRRNATGRFTRHTRIGAKGDTSIHSIDDNFADVTSSFAPPSESQSHTNFFMLPKLSSAELHHELCTELLSLLLEMPTPTWPSTIREKEWLESVKQVWDVSRTSHFLAEYFRSYSSV